MDPATRKENLLSFLIDMKIVAKAAEDKKIENNEDFKKRLAFARNRLLMDSLLAAEGKAALTDEAMKKVYEDAAKQITGEQEVHARHILVETEDEAKAIKAELKKGADFAELAKKEVQGSRRVRRRRSRLLHQGADGAGILRRSRSRSSPARFPIPSSRSSAGTSSRSRKSATARRPTSTRSSSQIEAYVTRKAQADYVAKLREAAKVERLDKARPPRRSPTPSRMPRSPRPPRIRRWRRRRSKSTSPLEFSIETSCPA